MTNELDYHSFKLHADGSVSFVRWKQEPTPQANPPKKGKAAPLPKGGDATDRASSSDVSTCARPQSGVEAAPVPAATTHLQCGTGYCGASATGRERAAAARL